VLRPIRLRGTVPDPSEGVLLGTPVTIPSHALTAAGPQEQDRATKVAKGVRVALSKRHIWALVIPMGIAAV